MNIFLKLRKKILFVFLCFSICGNAQDIIVKKDGSTILSRVTEVGTSEVKYKKWSNKEGPTYVILKSEILSINYENGEKEQYSQPKQDPPQTIRQDNNPPATTLPANEIKEQQSITETTPAPVPALTISEPESEQQTNNGLEDYRRSSLCLLLLTNKGDTYAKAIENQFLAMPLPSRYNSLNVDVRVINVSKSTNEKRVSKLLKDQSIAKQLVGKWFNRNHSGMMNMDRIHEWGGYNASFEDLKRAQSTERGLALLSDEGAELIKNTFVMVCDISYYDRQNTGLILAGVFAGLAGVAGGYAAQEAKKGNTANAQMWNSLKETGMTGAVASTDIAGFSVKVMAYLYRLKWNDKLRDSFYSNYWVDSNTTQQDAAMRRAAFDADKSSFQLEYLGQYRSRAGRTVSKSANQDNMGTVIREVCAEAVDNSINNLAKMFPVFKPKTTFYCKDDNIYAYIGTKEGVTSKSKYEMLETQKTSKGFEYKRVGTWKPTSIWNNKGMLITSENMEQNNSGTLFTRTSGQKDVCDRGLLIREMGKLGYQYKKNMFHLSLSVGAPYISEATEKSIAESIKYQKDAHNFEVSGPTIEAECGWLINYHTNFAWNPVNMRLGYGADTYINLAVTTGCILRTKPLGKNGKFALYLWPSVGLRICGFDVKYDYIESHLNKYVSGYYTYSGKPKYSYKTTYSPETKTTFVYSFDELNLFEWNLKLGVSLNEQWAIGFHMNDLIHAGFVSWYF